MEEQVRYRPSMRTRWVAASRNCTVRYLRHVYRRVPHTPVVSVSCARFSLGMLHSQGAYCAPKLRLEPQYFLCDGEQMHRYFLFL